MGMFLFTLKIIMKKILSLVVVILSTSITYAQSLSFQENYTALINQIAVLPSATGATNSSGHATIGMNFEAGVNNKWSLQIAIDYDVIVNMGAKWASTEMKFNSDTILNGSIEWQSINNIHLSFDGHLILTPQAIYIKVSKLSFDMSKLPWEIQETINTMNTYAQKNLLNTWIKVPLTKEMQEALQQGSAVNPQAIIALIQQYPIVKNAWYTNGNYAVTLNARNIANIINKIAKAQWSESVLSYSDIKAMEKTLTLANIKGTLSDWESPTLSLQGQHADTMGTIQASMSISQQELKLNGSVVDEDNKWSMNISVKKTSDSRYDYDEKIQFTSTNTYQPFSFDLSIKGHDSMGTIANYKLKVPFRAKTMEQIERSRPEYHANLWYEKIQDEEYIQSERYSKKAIQINNKGITFFSQEDLGTAYNNLCRAQTKQGKHEEALLNCNKAIEINPSDIASYDSRATVYENMKMEVQAQEDRAMIESLSSWN